MIRVQQIVRKKDGVAIQYEQHSLISKKTGEIKGPAVFDATAILYHHLQQDLSADFNQIITHFENYFSGTTTERVQKCMLLIKRYVGWMPKKDTFTNLLKYSLHAIAAAEAIAGYYQSENAATVSRFLKSLKANHTKWRAYFDSAARDLNALI